MLYSVNLGVRAHARVSDHLLSISLTCRIMWGTSGWSYQAS